MRYLLILFFLSCGTPKVVTSEDITNKVNWLDSHKDNPIINIIQKTYITYTYIYFYIYISFF